MTDAPPRSRPADGAGDLPELGATAAAILEAHWVEEGFTAPHPRVYPWRWLWDSCFCALVWAALGDGRALTELEAVFRWQHGDGFVPHIGYHRPSPHASLWGRPWASTLTQPPMYGHVVAELARRGVAVPRELVERAEAGVRWLLEHRRRPGGAVVIVHPWESGCDDSPHFDRWCGPLHRYEAKGDLVEAVRLHNGAAVASSAFEVASAGFNALVAFNADELGIDHGLPEPASQPPLTLDDLLVTLAWPDDALVELALDDRVFGGPFGPAGVRRDHAVFDGDGYWRGAAWPQLSYLLWVAASRQGRADLAGQLASRAVAGALRSGWAEHWNPDTGRPGGARPHSWSTVVALMEGPASAAGHS
ncbi:MAG TPA: hypothetical protein VFA11_04705 [Acidimicrobiales bacterium]|nr:hypothetical protein [Acidimicrobiales bacterium]